MASEIRVNKINSSTGVGTITLSPTGVDISGITTVSTLKVGTGLTASEDGDVFFTGVCTATTFTGSGANLTSLPAAQLTGTVADARFPATLPAVSAANLTSIPAANLTGALPAISGANLTGIAATDNVRTGILDVAGIATFRSDVNIPNINGGQVGGRRNMLTNGAMQINQRTQTGTLGYFNPVNASIYTLDRWRFAVGSSFDTDSAKIYHSSQTPIGQGFTKSLKVDIGNTATPSGSENALIQQNIEAQDLQHLLYGTSSAKTIILSFWVYSNKTGTYCLQVTQSDATKYVLFEYTISASNTWEKKTITIAGNTSDVITNDNGEGLKINWHLCCGSSDHVSATSTWTSSSSFLATSNQVNLWDNADNVWHLTGCQLEVGDTATEYEHRSFGDELSLCERYYQIIMEDSTGGGARTGGVGGTPYTNSSSVYCPILFRCRMRAEPTLESTASSTFRTRFGNSAAFNGFSGFNDAGDHSATIITNGNAGGGNVGEYIWVETNADAKLALDAEL